MNPEEALALRRMLEQERDANSRMRARVDELERRLADTARQSVRRAAEVLGDFPAAVAALKRRIPEVAL